jgi:O-antigen ligase
MSSLITIATKARELIRSISPTLCLWISGMGVLLFDIFGGPSTRLFGFLIDPIKVLSVPLLLFGLARLIFLGSVSARRASLVLASFYVVALIRGLVRADTSVPLAFSDQLITLGSLLAGLSFSRSDIHLFAVRDSLRRISYPFLALYLLGAGGWLNDIFPKADLSASGASIIATYLLCEFATARQDSASLRAWGVRLPCVLAFTTLVISQQRTVWVATGACLILLILESRRRVVYFSKLIIAACIIIALLSAVGFQGSRNQFNQERELVSSLGASAGDSQTFQWRIERWNSALQTNSERGWVAQAFGSGFGTKWVESGPQANRSEDPHNFYVEIFVRYGALGVFAWLVLLAVCGYRLVQNHRKNQGDPPAREVSRYFLTILVYVSIWQVSYRLIPFLALLLGLGFGVTARTSQQSSIEHTK